MILMVFGCCFCSSSIRMLSTLILFTRLWYCFLWLLHMKVNYWRIVIILWSICWDKMKWCWCVYVISYEHWLLIFRAKLSLLWYSYGPDGIRIVVKILMTWLSIWVYLFMCWTNVKSDARIIDVGNIRIIANIIIR